MISRGLTLAFVVAIALLARLDQGAALKCRVCNSLTNPKCSEDPSQIEPTACDGKPDPTEKPTPATNATTITAPTAATTKATEATTKATEATTKAPTEVTTNGTTKAPTDAPTKETTKPPTEVPTSPTPGTNGTTNGTKVRRDAEGESEDQQTEELDGMFRRRRNSPSVRDSDFVCYKLTYKSEKDNVVERGCYTKVDTCAKLKQLDDKKDADCYTCEKDGCNASSRISLGFLSVLAPAVLLAVVRW